MIERIGIVTVLGVIGFIAYQALQYWQKRRISEQVHVDPILEGLQQGLATIVYFTTPHCIPCKTQQQPTLERLQTQLGDQLQVVKIDATQDPESASRWGVMTAPTTFVLDKDWQPTAINHGVVTDVKLMTQLNSTVNVA